MKKNFSIKRAVLVVTVFLVVFITYQAVENPQSTAMWLNLTAANEFLVSLNPLFTTIGSAIGVVIGLATLIGLIKRYAEGQRRKKKYGESRTPVVVNAK
jgi:hypothetical protein